MRFTRIILAAAVAGAAVTGMSAASALGAKTCAPGYVGVVVENDGKYTSVCTNLLPSAGVAPCPNGDFGYDVYVSGKHVVLCAASILH